VTGTNAQNEIIDLIGDAGKDLDAFFNPAEFELRATLEGEHYWHLHRRAVIRDVVTRACPDRTLPIVELGCGVGTVATFLNQSGFSVDYADVHTEALNVARQRAAATGGGTTRGPRRFMRVDITRGLPPGDHRGILLLDVLEHLPDDAPVMRAAHDALTARGSHRDSFVLFTVPAFQMLWSPWDDLEKHKRRYTLAGARALAEAAGFEIIRATYFFFPLFFAAAAVKGLRTARAGLARKPQAARFDELTEAKNNAALNRTMLALLGVEQRWLQHHDLPLGTSVLVLARPRGRG
jgi:SAM-dependent methyltransferase